MNFSNAQSAELVGLLDPAGLGVGFMLPIFNVPLENARLIQGINDGGRVQRFEVAEDQDTPLLPTDNRTVSLGEDALWGFRLGDLTIADVEVSLRERLFELIEREPFRSRPMLALEVATFLGRSDLEDRYAHAAMRRLGALNADGARDWRDLSLLTPRLRRSLTSMHGIGDRSWLDEIYVTLDGGSASVHGMRGATGSEVSMLRKALDEVAGRLPSVFDRPSKGWGLRLVRDDGEIEGERFAADLWITVLGARLTKLLTRSVSGEALNVGIRSLTDADPITSRSTGIVFEARDERAEQEARFASVNTRTMMIAVGTAKRGVAETSPASNGEAPYGRIDLPNVGAYQGGALQVTDALAVRLAAAVAAELVDGMYKAPHPRSVLLRVAGESADPYALASLYGRAWALGLSPWNAVHVTDGKAVPPREIPDDDVRHHLFAGVEVVGGPLVQRALVGSRASGGLLVSSSEAAHEDVRVHASNAGSLLRNRRWRVKGADRHGEPRLQVIGDRWSATLRVPPMEAEKSVKRNPSGAMEIPSYDFEALDTLRLVPTSSSRTILDCLQAGEFPVEMRDLIRLDGSVSTIWSVVALQFIRLSSPLPSMLKTTVLGTIVRAALSQPGSSSPTGAGLLRDVLDESVGGALQLLFSNARWNDGRLRGKLSIVEKGHSPIRPTTTPFESYDLLVDEGGPRLGTSAFSPSKQSY